MQDFIPFLLLKLGRSKGDDFMNLVQPLCKVKTEDHSFTAIKLPWAILHVRSRSDWFSPPICSVTVKLQRNEGSTRGLSAMDHIILNHGQVTSMTSELAPPSRNYHTNRRKFQLSTDLTCIAALHGDSNVIIVNRSGNDIAAEKAFYVLSFVKSLSVITVQREFQNALTSKRVRRWCKQFQETGFLRKGKSPGRPGSQ
ncbi:hypothetical protein TNCV_1577201 [Trichonephila clavipes]|nr:hypothetical protein TNCV_1577201 [Trichonephila clavipes]